ncbi:uncharacterized protein N7496_006128 [Penicillium cataractarum]|uniref:Uncharacterized protein n=1 Tax=Penicillium cataractarum TaxID=2100454 RepID=A0A9W9S0Z8_9EURO|nr:uncharacterized protein N7496_006128 [Penicillium cataractarum]KAJ5370036.1 hypothetical protein N7496_006128 [Penicillium cataractarum]
MVLYDSKVVPELGTFANPILIEDDFALLDSSSDPNVIKVDEGWRCDEPDHLDSDADTEIMTTPEFWGSLTGGNFNYPEKHEAALDSSPIHASTRSIDSENLEGLQSVEQLGSNHQGLKVAQNSVDDPFGAATRESVADDHKGSEQSTKQGKVSKTEELKDDRSVTNTFSITRNGFPEETLFTDNPSWKNLSYSPYDMGSMTHRLPHETADNINRAKPLGKAVLAWDSPMSTAIGDELAEIHNHMEHCRNTDCLQAKAFFDGIQSPRE